MQNCVQKVKKVLFFLDKHVDLLSLLLQVALRRLFPAESRWSCLRSSLRSENFASTAIFLEEICNFIRTSGWLNCFLDAEVPQSCFFSWTWARQNVLLRRGETGLKDFCRRRTVLIKLFHLWCFCFSWNFLYFYLLDRHVFFITALSFQEGFCFWSLLVLARPRVFLWKRLSWKGREARRKALLGLKSFLWMLISFKISLGST